MLVANAQAMSKWLWMLPDGPQAWFERHPGDGGRLVRPHQRQYRVLHQILTVKLEGLFCDEE